MRAVLALTSAILLILLFAAPAAASKPLPFTIELFQQADANGQFVVPSPFTAHGEAVDAGILCEGGLAYNIAELVSGPGEQKNGFQAVFHTTKRFDCTDGSGSFILQISYHVDLTFEPLEWESDGPWNVDEGTGDYERLRGTGSMVSWPWGTTPDGRPVMYDILDGSAHID
jgi:hypothetical protein